MRFQQHNEEARRAGWNVGRALLVDGQCVAHAIHNIVSDQFNTDTLIPSLHALAFVASQLSTFAALTRALRAIVEEDLRTDFFRGTPPPAAAQYTAELVKTVVGSPDAAKQGSALGPTERGSPLGTPAAREALSELLKLLNGDWRVPRVQHFCVGACCEGGQRSVATERIAGLLVETLLRPIAKNILATNRWHTFSPTLAAQTAARFCHQALPRLLEWGLQPAQPEKAATDGEDEPPFRVYQNRRRRRALEFHLPEETSVTLGVAALVSAPLEKLSKVLQRLGHRGGSMWQLVSGKLGVLEECQGHLWELLSPGNASGDVAKAVVAVLRHQRAAGPFVMRLRQAVLGIAGALWARLHVPFSSWPWRLLRCVKNEHMLDQSDAETSGICDAFFAEKDCCLDDWWSAPFRAGLSGPSDLLSPQVQALLRSLGARLPSTSMSVEGLLSQMKAATPSSRHAPTMERQVHTGLLA